MSLKDKYTYLALLALTMFGIGYWMLSVAGASYDKPPAVPSVEQEASVTDQLRGALTLGEGKQAIDDILLEKLLTPEKLAALGPTQCTQQGAEQANLPLHRQDIVNEYLRPFESAFYMAADEDLSALEMLNRIQAAEFFYLPLHFDSLNARWVELGTSIFADSDMSILGSELESYNIRAGEPVLVYIFGQRTDSDVVVDELGVRKAKLKHCRNTFPTDPLELRDGWNFVVSDLVRVAQQPNVEEIFALDFVEGVQSLGLNDVLASATQVEGVLAWVMNKEGETREAFNEEALNIPRLRYHLESPGQVDVTASSSHFTLASYTLEPENSPVLVGFSLEALNVEGFKFSDLFSRVYFKLNGQFVASTQSLDSSKLTLALDQAEIAGMFDDTDVNLQIVVDVKDRVAVENLNLSLSAVLEDGRLASVLLPVLNVGFEKIVATLEMQNLIAQPKELIEYVADGPMVFSLILTLFNETSLPVQISNLMIHFTEATGLDNLNFTQASEDGDFAVTQDALALFTEQAILLQPNETRLQPLSFSLSNYTSFNLLMQDMTMDSNSVEVEYILPNSMQVRTVGAPEPDVDPDTDPDTDPPQEDPTDLTAIGYTQVSWNAGLLTVPYNELLELGQLTGTLTPDTVSNIAGLDSLEDKGLEILVGNRPDAPVLLNVAMTVDALERFENPSIYVRAQQPVAGIDVRGAILRFETEDMNYELELAAFELPEYVLEKEDVTFNARNNIQLLDTQPSLVQSIASYTLNDDNNGARTVLPVAAVVEPAEGLTLFETEDGAAGELQVEISSEFAADEFTVTIGQESKTFSVRRLSSVTPLKLLSTQDYIEFSEQFVGPVAYLNIVAIDMNQDDVLVDYPIGVKFDAPYVDELVFMFDGRLISVKELASNLESLYERGAVLESDQLEVYAIVSDLVSTKVSGAELVFESGARLNIIESLDLEYVGKRQKSESQAAAESQADGRSADEPPTIDLSQFANEEQIKQELKEEMKEKELKEQAAQPGLVDKDPAVSLEADQKVDLDQAELQDQLRDYIPMN